MGLKDNKQAYFDKLKELLEEYKSIFIVSVNNVRTPPTTTELSARC